MSSEDFFETVGRDFARNLARNFAEKIWQDKFSETDISVLITWHSCLGDFIYGLRKKNAKVNKAGRGKASASGKPGARVSGAKASGARDSKPNKSRASSAGRTASKGIKA